jgi:hypothetical protein
MLELALKQERIKYYKLKFGVEPTANDLKHPMNATNPSENSGNDLIYFVYFLL